MVYSWRWAKGFVCPVCGDTRHCVVKPRQLFQCT
ncbi:transposase, partial [Acidiphilium iwatense]